MTPAGLVEIDYLLQNVANRQSYSVDHATTLRLQYKAEVSIMSQTHPIELPEDIFVALLRIAEQKGVTPADWIASQIPAAFFQREECPLSDALNGITGSIDSSTEPRPQGSLSSVSDIIAEKYRKQGLIIP